MTIMVITTIVIRIIVIIYNLRVIKGVWNS